MLDKSVGRVGDVAVKYIGFNAPYNLLAGYGLGYMETYRSLQFIEALKQEGRPRRENASTGFAYISATPRTQREGRPVPDGLLALALPIET